MGQQLTTRSRVVCLQEKLKVELQEEGTHNTQLLHHPETVNPPPTQPLSRAHSRFRSFEQSIVHSTQYTESSSNTPSTCRSAGKRQQSLCSRRVS